MAISAGPLFTLNPSVSFFVNVDPAKGNNAHKSLDAMWEKLSQGGTALMPLDKYPLSERYGWIQDKYGLSWQVWPTAIGEMMRDGTRGQIDRVTRVFLQMKKFDIAALKKAYGGN